LGKRSDEMAKTPHFGGKIRRNGLNPQFGGKDQTKWLKSPVVGEKSDKMTKTPHFGGKIRQTKRLESPILGKRSDEMAKTPHFGGKIRRNGLNPQFGGKDQTKWLKSPIVGERSDKMTKTPHFGGKIRQTKWLKSPILGKRSARGYPCCHRRPRVSSDDPPLSETVRKKRDPFRSREERKKRTTSFSSPKSAPRLEGVFFSGRKSVNVIRL